MMSSQQCACFNRLRIGRPHNTVLDRHIPSLFTKVCFLYSILSILLKMLFVLRHYIGTVHTHHTHHTQLHTHTPHAHHMSRHDTTVVNGRVHSFSTARTTGSSMSLETNVGSLNNQSYTAKTCKKNHGWSLFGGGKQISS
jgi:hypothetical protein